MLGFGIYRENNLGNSYSMYGEEFIRWGILVIIISGFLFPIYLKDQPSKVKRFSFIAIGIVIIAAVVGIAWVFSFTHANVGY